jgi:hypothetical protein
MQLQAVDGLACDEMQIDSADQFLFRMYRLIDKMDGKQFLLQTVFLIFEDPILLNTVRVEFEGNTAHRKSNVMLSLSVIWTYWNTLYVEPDLRNFWQEFPQWCIVPIQPQIMNCNRGHPSSDRCCQVYMNERLVQELWVKKGHSFFLSGWTNTIPREQTKNRKRVLFISSPSSSEG